MSTRLPTPSLSLRVGQLVEIRSAAEILETLDERGELDGLPFMPEMARHCGQQFTVASVAHKICDTVRRSGMYKMNDAVHLTGAGSRCDGSAHGGCEAACLLYWKTSWLKRVDAPVNSVVPAADATEAAPRLLPLLQLNSRKEPLADGTATYSCQATEMPRAAPELLRLLEPKQYLQDIRSGNRGFWWVLRAFLVGAFNRVQGLSRNHLPGWMQFRDAMAWGFIRGSANGATQTAVTDLRPGELVRIRSKAEIMATLNKQQLNRGLGFDAEMSRFCGRTARVARRVNHIIDERTGRMLTMKTPCIVLEGVVCEGAYNVSCPRAIPPYWREIWLERIEG
jgi:hypothetical protein